MTDRRDVLAHLPAYRQGAMPDRDDVIKLSSNENPYPPLPSVIDVAARALDRMNLYPDMGAGAIRGVLAERFGVPVESIAVGAGSVEVATQLAHATAGDGDEVMFAWRSFEAYPILTQVAGATPIMVPLAADEGHDLDAMAAAITPRTRLIFVCTPNNPTGVAISQEALDRFLAKVPESVVVVVDEAYIHFNRWSDAASGLAAFRTHPNVVVLHTFSKAYGLAGLRIGYAVAPPPIAEDLRKVSVPFAVTDLAQRAALASLDAEDELNERVDRIADERERLTGLLRADGWTLPDSQANFVWLRTGEDTDRVDAVLREQGVLVRAFPGEGLRITVGTPGHTDRTVAALRMARAGA